MHTEHDIEKINRTNFRSSLAALSRPGLACNITPLFESPLLAMASVLLYAEVSHYCGGELDFELIRALCGSPPTVKDRADYLFFDSLEEEHLLGVKMGSPENPDSSSTLIFNTPEDCDTTSVQLSGPGINGTREISIPAGKTFLKTLARTNDSFPMGVDLFIVDGTNSLIGLPRTTKIEVIS